MTKLEAPDTGLTKEEVREQIRRGKVNQREDAEQRTVKDIITENIFTYFNAIFLVLAILLIVAKSYNGLTFLPVILANTLIGIAQEIYAKSVLDKMSILNAPTADVVRDGELKSIHTEKLVEGDLLYLKSGLQIPADAVVVSGELHVNEALLTGESDEIEKKAGSSLMSGSFVVSGEAYVRLTKVGAESYINRLLRKAKTMKGGEQSEMVRSIDRLVMVMGILLIPIGITLFVQSRYWQGDDFATSVSSMVAAVVGMIPEGLYLLVSVTLAMSAVRLATRQVMLHNMKSIESLARVDVLCVDKTGTITDTKMLVAGAAVPGVGPENPFQDAADEAALDWEDADEEALYQELSDSAKEAARAHIRANRAKTNAKSHKKSTVDEDLQELISRAVPGEILSKVHSYLSALPDDNDSMKAMREYFSEGQKDRAIGTLPFSSRNKYSAVQFSEGTYLLGAPEIVLKNNFAPYEEEVTKFASRGLRVMVFGRVKGKGSGDANSTSTVAKTDVSQFSDGIGDAVVEPVLFILLQNPIRQNARKTFAYFRKQGVEVKVISGDNPLTVSEVAKQAGIEHAENYVDARTLKTKQDILQATRTKTVFGRVTPEQKRLIVQALKHDGHMVAMTGDGVNDILAMKDADCSIAMASGSDAAVQSAQVALLDSEFSHLPEIVGEGRRVINNIERSATLFLVKNVFSILLALFSIFSTITYPLKPAQISLISAFNIGIPAFFLAMEPNHKRVEGKFLRRVLIRALPAALTDFFSIAALVVFGQTFGVDSTDISVAATFLLGIVGFIILWNISAPVNRYRSVVITGCAIGLILTAFLFNELFEIYVISPQCMMLFVLFAIATEPCMRYLTRLAAWIEARMMRRN